MHSLELLLRGLGLRVAQCVSSADTFEDDNCFSAGKDDLDFAR